MSRFRRSRAGFAAFVLASTSGPAVASPALPADLCASERAWLAAAGATMPEAAIARAHEALALCNEREVQVMIAWTLDNTPERCAEKRAWLAAEAPVPSLHRVLALEALHECAAWEGATM